MSEVDLQPDRQQEENANKTTLLSTTTQTIFKKDNEPRNNSIIDTTTMKVLTQNRFSYWNPLSWRQSNDNAIEDIESKIFKCLKTPVNRFYVDIRNNSLKIWTISANTDSDKTPIVLVHGFCGGIALWVHNIDSLRLVYFENN